MAEQNHYTVLQIDITASQDTIKRAYRRLSILYHPDKTGDDPALAEKLVEVNIAKDILSDPVKRKKYDDVLAGRSMPEQRPTFSSPTEAPIVIKLKNLFDKLEF